jgi:hypothetical protein
MVSIIWSTSGIHSLLALLAGMRYDAEFFYASILPDIERNLCDGNRRKKHLLDVPIVATFTHPTDFMSLRSPNC